MNRDEVRHSQSFRPRAAGNERFSSSLLTSTQHDLYVDRNREHQRLSRARRKDYVADLEARVRKYNQDGISVTAEVQVAARRAAEENHFLRALLEMHGISAAEMDRHLASSRHVSAATSSSVIPPNLYSRTQHPITAKQRTPHPISRPNQQVSHIPTPSASHSTTDEYRSPSPPDGSGPLTSECHYSAHDSDAPLDPAVISGKASHAEPTDETSCESAARIIASMRGHEDPEAFWPALGCSDTDKCMVKNIKIFQLADG